MIFFPGRRVRGLAQKQPGSGGQLGQYTARLSHQHQTRNRLLLLGDGHGNFYVSCTQNFHLEHLLQPNFLFRSGNGQTHIIRAHECIPAGYQYHKGGNCITIFSCSHYCGGINEAAVALVHDSQIRVVKVETTAEN